MVIFPAIFVLLLVLAAPAAAGDQVLHVTPDSIERRWDPQLPPDLERITPDPPPARTAAGPTVRKTLDRALERRRISRAQHERFNRIYTEARAVLRRRETVKARCRVQL